MGKKRGVTGMTPFVSATLDEYECFDGQKDKEQYGRIRLAAQYKEDGADGAEYQ